MMEIIAIGRIKEKAMQDMIAEYDKRLKNLVCTELVNSKKTNIQDIIDDESARILSKISVEDYVVLLDIDGKNFRSEEIAARLKDIPKKIIFVIGGSHGVNQEVCQRANLRWSLSHLTFPHQLVRVLLYEQIYRSIMIQNNHPYHK